VLNETITAAINQNPHSKTNIHCIVVFSTMGYTFIQQLTLVLLPKFSGGLGVMSSLFLMSEIIRDAKKGDTNPIKRVLLFVTIWEGCDALGWFLSTWMTPNLVVSLWSSSGNITTCNLQGLLLQCALGGPLGNCAFTYMFFILASGSWDAFAIQAFEDFSYCFISLFTVGLALYFLVLDQYNPINQVCLVAGYPLGCNESIFGSSDLPCERGINSHWYNLMLFYVLVWISFIFVITTNIRIRQLLAQQENNHDVSWITEQAMLYSAAFVITWTPSTLWYMLPLFGKSYFVFDVLAAIFEPLQAFWNLLIFLRGRPDSIQRITRIFSAIFFCSKDNSI
jgi:hypothetical protein